MNLTSTVLSVLASDEGGAVSPTPHADHNSVLVGVTVFLLLVMFLVATLAFNKDR